MNNKRKGMSMFEGLKDLKIDDSKIIRIIDPKAERFNNKYGGKKKNGKTFS